MLPCSHHYSSLVYENNFTMLVQQDTFKLCDLHKEATNLYVETAHWWAVTTIKCGGAYSVTVRKKKHAQLNIDCCQASLTKAV